MHTIFSLLSWTSTYIGIQGYHSPEKKIHDFSLTFLDEIAGHMSNKCTFINPNSPWTSHEKWTIVQVSYMISEKRVHCASQFMHSSHHSLVTSIVELPHSNFLTFPWLGAFSLTLAESPTFPGFQKFQKSGNPEFKPAPVRHVCFCGAETPRGEQRCGNITCYTEHRQINFPQMSTNN